MLFIFSNDTPLLSFSRDVVGGGNLRMGEVCPLIDSRLNDTPTHPAN